MARARSAVNKAVTSRPLVIVTPRCVRGSLLTGRPSSAEDLVCLLPEALPEQESVDPGVGVPLMPHMPHCANPLMDERNAGLANVRAPADLLSDAHRASQSLLRGGGV